MADSVVIKSARDCAIIVRDDVIIKIKVSTARAHGTSHSGVGLEGFIPNSITTATDGPGASGVVIAG